MVCINCGALKTSVINSRENTKTIRTWRRRRCANCRITFTTSERLDFESLYVVRDLNDMPSDLPFSEPKLAMSILEVMNFATEDALQASFWLTRTVMDKIAYNHPPTSPLVRTTIAQLTYETLAAYDSVAGLAYAKKHHVPF